MPKIIDPELCLVIEHQLEYPSLTAAAAAVAKQLGVGKESVRRWVIQDQVDAGTRDGGTTQESEEIRRLKGENRRLREDVAILKAATSFFAGGHSIPATADDGLHRRREGWGPRGRVDL